MSHEKTASRGELKPFSDGSYFEGPTTNNTTSARENRSPPRCCRGPMPVEPFWNDRRILLVVLVSQLKGHRMKIRTIALATALALASAAVLAQAGGTGGASSTAASGSSGSSATGTSATSSVNGTGGAPGANTGNALGQPSSGNQMGTTGSTAGSTNNSTGSDASSNSTFNKQNSPAGNNH